jgi:S1-C subfamily serine protease
MERHRYADNVSVFRFVFHYEEPMNSPMKKLIRLALGAMFGIVLMVALPGRAAQTGASSATAAGRFTPGYLGVYLQATGSQAAGQDGGAVIMGVDRDAPAGHAGLRPHDVIVGLDGKPVRNDLQLRKELQSLPAGRLIHLRLIRDGKTMNVAVKLASRTEVEAAAWPEGVIFADGFPVTGSGSSLAGMPFGSHIGPSVKLREFAMLGCDGLEVEPLGRQLASYFGVPKGTGLLVRNVEPKSVGAAAGLQAGDVITAADGMPSSTLRGWLMVVSQNQGKVVNLKVIRNRKLKLIQYTPGGQSR